ncbi:MAG: class II aldolase/adducin family protein [Pseudomonadota bacterium]
MQQTPREDVTAGRTLPEHAAACPRVLGARRGAWSDRFRSFCTLSARIGADRSLVQGAGGNSSIKHDGVLWVKASGTWLARSLDEAIYVSADLALIRNLLRSGTIDPVSPALRPDAAERGLKASIETTLHALLDHNVVLHLHSVAAIALAVREDAERLLAPRLEGLSWAFVPYARPGLPLTRAVMEAIGDSMPDLLVLANHGIVVGGEDYAAAESILTEVERRLQAKPRPDGPADLQRLQTACRGTGYRLPKDKSCHAIATDSRHLAIAAGGSLYPDHVVFLGPGMTVVEPTDDLPHSAERGDAPAFLAIRDVGVVVREELPAAAEVMVGCLVDVLRRIPKEATVTYLSGAEEDELLGWDAEKLRQAMNKGN